MPAPKPLSSRAVVPQVIVASPSSPPPAIRLRYCFQRWYLPDLTNARTIETFECALTLWEKLTGNPVVDKIDDETLIMFRDRLLAMGRRPATFNKYRGHLLAILRRLGPQMPGNWQGLGLLKRIPFVRKLPANPIPKRILSQEDLAAWYLGARFARWPASAISPVDFWRAIIVLIYNTAPRKGDVLALRWDDVDFAQGVVRFTARKTEKRQAVPMNDVLRSHLERIRGFHEHVFPASHAPWYLLREAKRLQSLGGIEKPYTIHDLRRTSTTAFNRFQRGLGNVMGGHVPKSVTEAYYEDPFGTLSDAVAAIPQPDVFRMTAKQLAAQELRPPKIAPPPGNDPSPKDWEFDFDGFTFRGRRCDVRRWGYRRNVRLRFLQALVEAGRPLSPQRIRELVWPDRAKGEGRISHATFRRQYTDANTILRRFFGWPRTVRPIRKVQQSGHYTCYEFRWPAGQTIPEWQPPASEGRSA